MYLYNGVSHTARVKCLLCLEGRARGSITYPNPSSSTVLFCPKLQSEGSPLVAACTVQCRAGNPALYRREGACNCGCEQLREEAAVTWWSEPTRVQYKVGRYSRIRLIIITEPPRPKVAEPNARLFFLSRPELLLSQNELFSGTHR